MSYRFSRLREVDLRVPSRDGTPQQKKEKPARKREWESKR